MLQARESITTWKWYTFNQHYVSLGPQTSGVYCLGLGNDIIYIGSSANLQERLTDHLYTNDPCIKKAAQFAIEPCPNYKERERQRLLGFQSDHGRLPACNDRI